jgi:phosphoglucosamine mutase
MSPKYFGTDGIRGRAGTMLTPELALRASCAYARLLCSEATGRCTVVIGGDPRLSTPMLRAAAASGVCLAGADVVDLGIVPTPLVPFMQLRRRYAGGLMVTASHNPVPDNGLKFFGQTGQKITTELESKIEESIETSGWMQALNDVPPGDIAEFDAGQLYLAWLQRQFKADSKPLRLVLDCAYGATSELAPLAFEAAGYEVHALHARFDGSRVNVNSGATSMGKLRSAVKASKADLGIAFDGDGDRMLAVDAKGQPVSGDKIIALFALNLPRYRSAGRVVMTHMTNLGVEEALRRHGIEMVRTDVGDALVAAAMDAGGINLGGEQSGHIIMCDKAPTGDGILAGLQLAAIIRSKQRPLHELVAEFQEYPQQLTNLTVRDKAGWRSDAKLQSELKNIQFRHADVRFYLRPSGTENLLRVLTEARDPEQCRVANAEVCATFQAWDSR